MNASRIIRSRARSWAFRRYHLRVQHLLICALVLLPSLKECASLADFQDLGKGRDHWRHLSERSKIDGLWRDSVSELGDHRVNDSCKRGGALACFGFLVLQTFQSRAAAIPTDFGN